jgi:hypothetical protein
LGDFQEANFAFGDVERVELLREGGELLELLLDRDEGGLGGLEKKGGLGVGGNF